MKHVLDVTEPCQNDIDMEFLKTIEKPNWKGKKLNKMNKFVQVVYNFMQAENVVQRMSGKKLGEIFGKDDVKLFLTYFKRKGNYKKGLYSFSYKLNQRGLDFFEKYVKEELPQILIRDNRELEWAYTVKIEKDAIQYIETDDARVNGLYADMDTGVLHYRYATGIDRTKKDILLRTYATVQNIPSELKRKVFKGWFDIDIVSCAYSVLEQDMKRYQKPLLPEGESILDLPWFSTDGLSEAEIVILNKAIKGIRLNILFANRTTKPSKSQLAISKGYKNIVKLYKAHPELCMHLVNGEEFSAMLKLIRKIKKFYKTDYRFSKYVRPHYKAFTNFESEIGQVIQFLHRGCNPDNHLVNYIQMHDGFIVKDPLGVDEYIGIVRDLMGLNIKLTIKQY